MFLAPSVIEFSLCFLAETERMRFINTLSLKEGLSHQVTRNDIYGSVLALFTTNHEALLSEYPLRIHFSGERAVDEGGVSRDLFSAFFEALYVKYFDGASLLYPSVNPHVRVSKLRTIGLIVLWLHLLWDSSSSYCFSLFGNNVT